MVSHPIRRFCDQQGWRISDRAARAAYDGASARRLAAFSPDLVVLDSYLYRLSRPMLSAYSGRIINVHHADLLMRNAMGRARFVGLRAVRDAILSGAADTRATVHIVTDEVDDGPPLVRSWPFAVAPLARTALAWGAPDILKAYAFAHQEWMIRATWGPLVMATLALILEGRLDLDTIADEPPGRVHPFELDASGRIQDGSRSQRVTARAALAAAG